MHDDIKWVLGLFIFFGLIWLISGGPGKLISRQGPLLKPLAPVGSGEAYGPDILGVNKKTARGSGTAGKTGTSSSGSGTYSLPGQTYVLPGTSNPYSGGSNQQTSGTSLNPNASPLSGQLVISNVSYAADPSSEYVALSASSQNKNPIELTGLRLESAVTGNGTNIGEGVVLPFQGQINVNEPVYLAPGGTAYVISGRSPVGISFQENECTGFFGQFQNFHPSLSFSCPLPQNDVPAATWRTFEDACIDYVDGLSGCRVYPNPPATLSPACRTYVTENINYNQCVNTHKPDPGFYRGVWRVYLSRDSSLWKTRRETILLLDQNGKEIYRYSY